VVGPEGFEHTKIVCARVRLWVKLALLRPTDEAVISVVFEL
jgi:hypothetical protein